MSKDISNRFVSKAKRFREHYNISEKNLDILLKEKKLTYTKLEYGKRTLTLELAEGIAEVYGLTYCKFIEPDQGPPEIKDLPIATQEKIETKEGKFKVAQKGTLNLNENIVIVLNKYVAGNTFTNSQIISKLPKDLVKHMTGKSIEWNKGILKDLVIDTKKTSPSPAGNNFKQEKIYELVMEITPEMLEKAKEKIGKSSNQQ